MRPRFFLTDNYAFLLAGLLFFFLLVPVLHTLVLQNRNIGLMRVCVQSGFSAMMLVGVWSLGRRRFSPSAPRPACNRISKRCRSAAAQRV